MGFFAQAQQRLYNPGIYRFGGCHYEKLVGKSSEQVCWFDITGREDQLRQIGIDPHKALVELHVSDETGRIRSSSAPG
jgi:hypothetical protein